MNKNAEYIRTVDLGFERKQILNVRIQGPENYAIMKNAIENHSGIMNVAGSRDLVWRSWSSANVESEGTQQRITVIKIGEADTRMGVRAGFTTEFTIDMREYEMPAMRKMDESMLGREVHVIVSLELIRA